MAKASAFEQGLQILDAWDEVSVFHADDSFAELEELIRLENLRSVAVFTGRNSADSSGAWAKLLTSLRYGECAAVRFKDIPPEPDMDTVENMVQFLRQAEPDAVIALGGGSVLDAAKAAYIVFQTQMPLSECFGSDLVSKKFPGRKFKRIIAIPTTSGTGSEITQYSNIVNRINQVKQLISDPVLVPQAAGLNGQLTASMPRSVTLATGCDALAHLLEGWLNVTMDEGKAFINNAARVGVELVRDNLAKVLSDPDDLSARKAMQIASALGGLTIRNKSTGLPHLLSFSWFGRIEHGIAVARLLPAAWRYYVGRKEVTERTLEIGKVLGGTTVEAVINNYERVLELWQVPKLNSFAGLTTELLEQTCRSAGANRMKLELAPRPVPLEASENVLRDILSEAMKS
ncbi:MAG: iron-containing alcohol dehydrogenase [Lentisphaeria bacterium]|nr:iron-containing alcohol dehydrogenase [Lentisphaeria bacterium]